MWIAWTAKPWFQYIFCELFRELWNRGRLWGNAVRSRLFDCFVAVSLFLSYISSYFLPCAKVYQSFLVITMPLDSPANPAPHLIVHFHANVRRLAQNPLAASAAVRFQAQKLVIFLPFPYRHVVEDAFQARRCRLLHPESHPSS